MAKSAPLGCRLLLGLLVVLALAQGVVCRAVQTGDYESTEQSEEQEVVDELHSLLPVRDSSSSPETPARDDDLCAAIFCGNGRKCVLENGRPTCGCALTCPDHYTPICGSDGITYQNPCELHRAACLQNIKIHKHLRGPCPAPPPTPEPPAEEEKPLVCYEIERDQLRQLLIDWMKGRVEQDKMASKDKSYAEVLTENFRGCDLDGDDQLSGFEFIQCVEKNETVAEFTGERPEHGHVLRGLCVDALILMSDTNEDWMLDLEEFLRCMDPSFEPPRKQCSLENKLYEDGAETRVDCNICVCACGNWVCSAMSCSEIDDYNLFEPYDVEQGPLPSKEERYALLRGFMAAEHVNLDRLDQEVPPPAAPDGNLPVPPAPTPDTVPPAPGTLRPAYGHPGQGQGEEQEQEQVVEQEGQEQEDGGDAVSEELFEVPPAPAAPAGPQDPAPARGVDLPPSGTREADGNEALQEFLSSGGATTVRPDGTPTVRPDGTTTVRPDGTTTVRHDGTTSSPPPPPPAVQQASQSGVQVERLQPESDEEVVVPEEATPRPAPPPARRFIPVVNFNITVAEHRVVHVGNPERAEQMDVRAETLLHQQNTPRHGHHGHNHQHHHRKDHHSHHHHHRSRDQAPSQGDPRPLAPSA